MVPVSTMAAVGSAVWLATVGTAGAVLSMVTGNGAGTLVLPAALVSVTA